MVSLPDDQITTQAADAGNFAAPAKPKSDWTAQLNTEQVFRLIDSILPFEACLYHQLLPLSLEGSHLKLGMVNLDDTAALDYVRRILAYMNCSLVPQTLATDVHHAALSAYLSYTGSQKQPLSRPTTARAIAQHTGQRLNKDLSQNDSTDANMAARAAEPSHLAQDSNPTFLVDSPEDLNFQDLDLATPQAPPSAVVPPMPTSRLAADARSTAPELTDAELTAPALTTQEVTASEVTAQKTIIQEQETIEQPLDASRLRETLILKPEQLPATSRSPEISTPGDALPILPVEPKHLSKPITALASLPPRRTVGRVAGTATRRWHWATLF